SKDLSRVRYNIEVKSKEVELTLEWSKVCLGASKENDGGDVIGKLSLELRSWFWDKDYASNPRVLVKCILKTGSLVTPRVLSPGSRILGKKGKSGEVVQA
ncbi:hypothetical protein Tco_1128687, partial [Tanacetum coccineum]